MTCPVFFIHPRVTTTPPSTVPFFKKNIPNPNAQLWSFFPLLSLRVFAAQSHSIRQGRKIGLSQGGIFRQLRECNGKDVDDAPRWVGVGWGSKKKCEKRWFFKGEPSCSFW